MKINANITKRIILAVEIVVIIGNFILGVNRIFDLLTVRKKMV